jgi:hypothetical protein
VVIEDSDGCMPNAAYRAALGRSNRDLKARGGLFGAFPIGAARDHERQPRSRVPAV